MAIIKSAKSTEAARRAVVLDLGDLRAEAERLERESGDRARAIIDDAQRERERLLEVQRSEGFDMGLAEGRAQGLGEGRDQGRADVLEEHRTQIESLIRGWSGALERLEAQRAELVASAERDVLRLAIEIAHTIVHRSIELDPTIVESQLQAAVAQALAPSRLVVEIHPDDEGIIESALPQLKARLVGCEEVILRVDPELDRGSVRLGTARGEIDASIQTQLDRITEAILPGGPVAGPAGGAADGAPPESHP